MNNWQLFLFCPEKYGAIKFVTSSETFYLHASKIYLIGNHRKHT